MDYLVLLFPLSYIFTAWPLIITSPLLVYLFSYYLKFSTQSKILNELILALWLKFCISDIYYFIYYLILRKGPFENYFSISMISYHFISLLIIWALSRSWYFIVSKTYFSIKKHSKSNFYWLLITLSLFLLYVYTISLTFYD